VEEPPKVADKKASKSKEPKESKKSPPKVDIKK